MTLQMQQLLVIMKIFLLLLMVSSLESQCPPEQISFEMVTGYVYTAPDDILDSKPGTLMLTDCIDTCRKNTTCQSINYETGLCVLFSSSENGQLTPSQFPVFTSYLQKFCMSNSQKCSSAWSFERVLNYSLETTVQLVQKVENRVKCMELCFNESKFTCRSASFNIKTQDCSLSDMDRHTLGVNSVFKNSEGLDYLEINCFPLESAPINRLCIFETTKGRILKTVDSVYQAIASRSDCQDLCIFAPFRCHSYDYNDTGDNVCRLSHHSSLSLSTIDEPYLAIEEATTYELSSCYNVSIDCHSSDMTATVKTTNVFHGKIYAKASPSTCVLDITGQMEFSMKMAYNDLECGVLSKSHGSYSNEIIIQHHDRIVTASDLGLSLSCQYDLTNRSVSNAVDLAISGEISPSLFEESAVASPNVIMKVADENGQSTKTAIVGEPLSLIFEILDQESSPYEIFIRDLVAVDGATEAELLLIDSEGCPVDTSIMTEIRRGKDSEKDLISFFDAFRFPTSETVQFRAMVTPCLPTCPPRVCDVKNYSGTIRSLESYGRKKRDVIRERTTMMKRQKRETEPSEVLVVQSLRIVDRYGKSDSEKSSSSRSTASEIPTHFLGDSKTVQISENSLEGYNCINETSLMAGAIIFLSLQFILIIFWILVWKRKRSVEAKEILNFSSSENSTSDSLCYLYDSGFTRRHT